MQNILKRLSTGLFRLSGSKYFWKCHYRQLYESLFWKQNHIYFKVIAGRYRDINGNTQEVNVFEPTFTICFTG